MATGPALYWMSRRAMAVAIASRRASAPDSDRNGDLIESTSLMSGAFPAKYGDRTGSILDVETRDGGRDRIATRFSAGFLGASLTSEGPLGPSKKGSWLISARKSYLGYLLKRLNVRDG